MAMTFRQIESAYILLRDAVQSFQDDGDLHGHCCICGFGTRRCDDELRCMGAKLRKALAMVNAMRSTDGKERAG
jgi:hypothetical protein